MSVLITLRVTADASKVEAEDKETFRTVTDRAKGFGVISHRFYGNENEILVVDEWPDEASFQAFFAASPEIEGLMARAGVTSQPETTVWRELDTGDAIG